MQAKGGQSPGWPSSGSTYVGHRRVGPTCKFAASPEVDLGATVGTLQTGYPAYKLQIKTRRSAYIRTLPRVIWLRTLPPYRDRLGRCHMPHGSAPRLLGAVTCCTTPDPTSLLGRAPVLSRVARLRTPPPCSVGLQCCHVPHSFGPRLPARKGSSAATCHMTSDLTTLLGRAPILPRVTRLRTPPPCSGGLQCCHVPHGFRPCLPVRGGSGTVTCPTSQRESRALRTKKVLAVKAYNKARIFSRYAHVLPRHLQRRADR
jgi:hypothetical protein